MIDPADLARMNLSEPARSVLFTSLFRDELKDFYKYELLSQKREARIGVVYSGFLLLAFLLVFCKPELIVACCTGGVVLSFILGGVNWRWHFSVIRELESIGR